MANLDRRQLNIELSEGPPENGRLECGVDEVGIGSAIAEVYAAACILDPERRINGLRDSKQLTHDRRKELSERIRARALDFSIHRQPGRGEPAQCFGRHDAGDAAGGRRTQIKA